jgi:hypothetical protein
MRPHARQLPPCGASKSRSWKPSATTAWWRSKHATLHRNRLRLLSFCSGGSCAGATGSSSRWRLSPESAVNIHGFHSEHILIILDEAPGIRAEIWDAIEGARASGNVRLLALGNPTIPGGPFYEAFTRARGLWKTITIDAFETPNLEGLTEADFDMMQADLRESDPFFAHCGAATVRARHADEGCDDRSNCPSRRLPRGGV